MVAFIFTLLPVFSFVHRVVSPSFFLLSTSSSVRFIESMSAFLMYDMGVSLRKLRLLASATGMAASSSQQRQARAVFQLREAQFGH